MDTQNGGISLISPSAFDAGMKACAEHVYDENAEAARPAARREREVLQQLFSRARNAFMDLGTGGSPYPSWEEAAAHTAEEAEKAAASALPGIDAQKTVRIPLQQMLLEWAQASLEQSGDRAPMSQEQPPPAAQHEEEEDPLQSEQSHERRLPEDWVDLEPPSGVTDAENWEPILDEWNGQIPDDVGHSEAFAYLEDDDAPPEKSAEDLIPPEGLEEEVRQESEKPQSVPLEKPEELQSVSPGRQGTPHTETAPEKAAESPDQPLGSGPEKKEDPGLSRGFFVDLLSETPGMPSHRMWYPTEELARETVQRLSRDPAVQGAYDTIRIENVETREEVMEQTADQWKNAADLPYEVSVTMRDGNIHRQTAASFQEAMELYKSACEGPFMQNFVAKAQVRDPRTDEAVVSIQLDDGERFEDVLPGEPWEKVPDIARDAAEPKTEEKEPAGPERTEAEVPSPPQEIDPEEAWGRLETAKQFDPERSDAERLDAFNSLAERQADSIRDTPSLLSFLDTQARMPTHTARNVMGMMAQNPHITDIRSEAEWQRAGFGIRKGAPAVHEVIPTEDKTGFTMRRAGYDAMDVYPLRQDAVRPVPMQTYSREQIRSVLCAYTGLSEKTDPGRLLTKAADKAMEGKCSRTGSERGLIRQCVMYVIGRNLGIDMSAKVMRDAMKDLYSAPRQAGGEPASESPITRYQPRIGTLLKDVGTAARAGIEAIREIEEPQKKRESTEKKTSGRNAYNKDDDGRF